MAWLKEAIVAGDVKLENGWLFYDEDRHLRHDTIASAR